MKIDYLKISKNLETYKYDFCESVNLIYSEQNSKGKTTLLRFLLYSALIHDFIYKFMLLM